MNKTDFITLALSMKSPYISEWSSSPTSCIIYLNDAAQYGEVHEIQSLQLRVRNVKIKSAAYDNFRERRYTAYCARRDAAVKKYLRWLDEVKKRRDSFVQNN